MGFIALGLSKAGCLDFDSFGSADLGEVGSFAPGCLDSCIGLVLLDLDLDFGAGQIFLFVGETRLLLHVDALLLGILLLPECLDLLVCNLALLENHDDLWRQNDILDVDTACLHVVVLNLFRDVLLGCHLNRGTLFDELDRLHSLKLITEVVADNRLQDLVDEILHCADHRDDLGGHLVGDMDLNLEVDLEDEPFLGFGFNLTQTLVQVVCLGSGRGPVEGEDRCRNDLRRIDSRVDGVLAGTQRLLPDAAMAWLDDGTELEFRA